MTRDVRLRGRLPRDVGARAAGLPEEGWRGEGAPGAAVASGVHVARLDAGGRVATRRILLAR